MENIQLVVPVLDYVLNDWDLDEHHEEDELHEEVGPLRRRHLRDLNAAVTSAGFKLNFRFSRKNFAELLRAGVYICI